MSCNPIKLATEITITAIQNGLSHIEVDNVVKFFNKVYDTLKQHQIDWEISLNNATDEAITHEKSQD